MRRTLLIVEFVVIFVLLPLAFRFATERIPALLALWVVVGYALWQLLRAPRFDRARLWNAAQILPHLASILAIFAASAFVLWLCVHHFAPRLEWILIRQQPAFWLLVMLAYPVLSVYPQGLLFRAFFFERYATLFPGKWTMIVASAVAFAFLHIVFRNPLAVALTFVGGLLFAGRYQQTRSLAASSLEHALYGCWLFTVGLGPYFYHATLAFVGGALHH